MTAFERITGRGGRTLASRYDQTYLGTVLPGFPGFFQLTGANTGLGHSSMVHVIESQLAFITHAIAAIEAAGGGPCTVPARRRRRLQRPAAAPPAPHRLGVGLLQLVPRRERAESHLVAGVHVWLSGSYSSFPGEGVHY